MTDSTDFVLHRPEVESRWAVMATLGIAPPADEEDGWPCLRPSQTAQRHMDARLAESAVVEGQAHNTVPYHPHPRPLSRKRERGGVGLRRGPLVVVHVGAGTAAKSWPVEHWRKLIGRLIVERGAQLVLVGGGKDRIITRRILGDRPWPGVTDWTGRLSIDELAALLRRAEVMVGADSGPAHLAAAVDTPVVVLFSGTNHASQWQPRGRSVAVVRQAVACSPCHRERCPLADHPCMTRLLPRRVAAEVGRILDEASSRNQTDVVPATTGMPQGASAKLRL